MEHLVAIGLEKIVRIGGQSKSKILERKNLRIVAQSEGKSKYKGYSLAMTYKAIKSQGKSVKKLLGAFHSLQDKRGHRWETFDHYLKRTYPEIHSQSSRVDDEGFQIVGDPFNIRLTPPTAHTSAEQTLNHPLDELLALATQNIYSITVPGRIRLVDFWISQISNETTDSLFEAVKRADRLG